VTGVYGATVNDGGLDLIVDQARNKLAEILARTTAAGVSVRSVEIKEPDLEAVFLHLTGRALRD
jgi:ABC-2 type transport system ATP-binding protein